MASPADSSIIENKSLPDIVESYIDAIWDMLESKGCDNVSRDDIEKVFKDAKLPVPMFVPAPTPVPTPVATSASCPFVITRGDRKGLACGKKNKAGSQYCSSHDKSASVAGGSAPVATSATTSATPTRIRPIAVVSSTHDTTRMLFPETNIVIDPVEKIAVAKENSDGSVSPLDDTDRAMCVEKRIPLKVEDNVVAPTSSYPTITYVPPPSSTSSGMGAGSLASSVPSIVPSASSSASPKLTCPFVITRGDRKGLPCGKNCSKGSTTCSSHKGK